MTSARDIVLGKIRTALAGSGPVEVPRAYRRTRPADNLVELFAERVAEYRAITEIVSDEQVSQAVGTALRDRDAHRIVVPDGFPQQWRAAGDFMVLNDSDGGTGISQVSAGISELDTVDAVVTTATVGIASTGTVVLDHGAGQGRRALTLVPDMHICIIKAAEIVDDVPAAMSRLDPVRPCTFISGPSATSDIELARVEGVHGPRTLHVVIARE